jgi:hypothetical protein
MYLVGSLFEAERRKHAWWMFGIVLHLVDSNGKQPRERRILPASM